MSLYAFDWFWLIAKTNIPGNYKQEKLSVYLNQPCYWVVTQLPARCLGILAPGLCNPTRLKGDNRKYLNTDLILWLMGKSNKYSESAETTFIVRWTQIFCTQNSTATTGGALKQPSEQHVAQRLWYFGNMLHCSTTAKLNNPRKQINKTAIIQL